VVYGLLLSLPRQAVAFTQHLRIKEPQTTNYKPQTSINGLLNLMQPAEIKDNHKRQTTNHKQIIPIFANSLWQEKARGRTYSI
jgi:hypothetical protein